MEKRPAFKSGDWVAALLLPRRIQLLFKVPALRRAMTRVLGPQGVYEWVIARTRYIDEVCGKALADGIRQLLIIGAGFDSRGIRFTVDEGGLSVYELDAPTTQEAKRGQYRARNIAVPAGNIFLPINFEKESMVDTLRAAGFRVGAGTLVIAEGVFQYLKPDAVHATLRSLRAVTSPGSRLVFDFAHASVLRGEGTAYGEARMTEGVRRFGESWQFGLEHDEVGPLLAAYSFALVDMKGPGALEDLYFRDRSRRLAGRVNGTQSIAMAERVL